MSVDKHTSGGSNGGNTGLASGISESFLGRGAGQSGEQTFVLGKGQEDGIAMIFFSTFIAHNQKSNGGSGGGGGGHSYATGPGSPKFCNIYKKPTKSSIRGH